jgi:hypothetical protein
MTIGDQNVAPLELEVDESNTPYGLELAMVIICNSNDEILPRRDWEFQLRSGGLNCFKIYIYYIECKKKDCTKKIKFNYTRTFHQMMEGAKYFFQK